MSASILDYQNRIGVATEIRDNTTIEIRSTSRNEKVLAIAITALATVAIVAAIVSLTISGFAGTIGGGVWIAVGVSIIATTLTPLAIRHDRLVQKVKQEIESRGDLQEAIDQINQFKEEGLEEGKLTRKRSCKIQQDRIAVFYTRKDERKTHKDGTYTDKANETSRVVFASPLSLLPKTEE